MNVTRDASGVMSHLFHGTADRRDRSAQNGSLVSIKAALPSYALNMNQAR